MPPSRRSFLRDIGYLGAGVTMAPRQLWANATFGPAGKGARSASAPLLNELLLMVQTRDEESFDVSSGRLVLFSGITPIVSSWNPPPSRGKAAFRIDVFSNYIDRDALVATQAFLGLNNNDKWFPRSAFLWGGDLNAPPRQNIVPLAYDFGMNPNFPTTSLEGSRFPLQMITPGTTAEPWDLLIVVILTCSPDSGHTDPETAGPLELSIYGSSGLLQFHTTLSRIGRQDPGRGPYLAALPIAPGLAFDASNAKRAVITNKSDDAWWPTLVEIFVLSRSGHKGRHLGGIGDPFCFKPPKPYISQDPNDVTSGPDPAVNPGMSLNVPLAMGP